MAAVTNRLPVPSVATATALIVLTSLCFGIVPLFARQLFDEGLSVEAIAFYRFALTLPIALPFLPRTRRKLRPALLVFAAGLAMALGWTGYLRAIETAPLASAGIIYMSYPLFVVILARLLIGQPITLRAVIAGALVLAAAALMLAPTSLASGQPSALLLCLPAPISFALLIIVLSAMAADLTTMERICCGMLGAVSGLLPAALAQDASAMLPSTADGWALILAMAVTTATLPQIVYTYATPHIGPSRSAVAGAMELPTMIAVGWLAFGEAIGPTEVLSAGLIVTAIALAPAARSFGLGYRPPLRPGHGIRFAHRS
jgi:drug/metabolite transporter (DMT)-like permease